MLLLLFSGVGWGGGASFRHSRKYRLKVFVNVKGMGGWGGGGEEGRGNRIKLFANEVRQRSQSLNELVPV